MEVNLQQKRKGLEVKIPDISKTLDVVRFLEARRVSRTDVSDLHQSLIYVLQSSVNDLAPSQRQYQSSQRQTMSQRAKGMTMIPYPKHQTIPKIS